MITKTSYLNIVSINYYAYLLVTYARNFKGINSVFLKAYIGYCVDHYSSVFFQWQSQTMTFIYFVFTVVRMDKDLQKSHEIPSTILRQLNRQ